MDPTPPTGDVPVVPPPPAPAPVPAPPARRRFPWWRGLRAVIAFLFVLVATSVLLLTFGLYLAATGRNLPMLRAAVGVVGRAMAGQRTTALLARVDLRPAARTLAGEATLTVRADSEGRRQLYFLLNDGLRLRDARQSSDDGARAPLSTMRLGPLVVVQLARPLAAGETTKVTLAYGGELKPGGLTGTGAVIEADDVVITPADFWYPADVQGAFDADVEVLLPADLTLAHNGSEQHRIVEGTSARVRFTSERPVAGLALVAGRYQVHERDNDGRQFRVLLPPGSELDGEKLLESMIVAERGLAQSYGPSGFARATLYVPRHLPRAFNDGSGLLGIPPRYFHDGRYGFEAVAHELAHDWWGATVAERWLAPGTGGEWIVEGFAQYSAWRAVAARFGQAAFVHALQRNFFDPDTTGVLAEASVLDNGLDPNARATIYRKGGYVTYLLAQQLGADGFDAAARALLDKYRYRPTDDAAVQEVFAATSQQDLAPFFATWVRSKASIDLSLEPQEGGAAVRNLRPAPAPDRVALWRGAAGDETERTTAAVGETAADVGAQRLLLDPLAAVADMFRSNNVLPRVDTPRHVAAAPHGELLVVDGEPVAWEPAMVRVLSSDGKTLHSWAIDRGLVGDPTWSADGSRIVALESARDGEPTLLALRLGDGGRQTLGHDRIAAADGDGTVVARDGRLIRLGKGRGQVLITHPDARIGALLPAPNDGGIAYALVRGTEMELRLLPPGAADSRVLFSWAASPPLWAWAPDGSRLFVALPGDWDWQLWELPVDDSEPRRLVREAARITAVAAAPDSAHVAIVAQAEVDEPDDRTELFVIDSRSNDVRRFNEAATTFVDAAWLDDDALAAI
ncbi:MAG TPA: M1 family aminopeptidase, partial [Candidatus Dormibacteraeota bacterium]|nr:M1 family aminopeptidase [Candidatus Dormibacteraeota bacterium]